MADAAPKRMSLAEFLAWDDGTDTHYERVRGHVVAMAPGRARHGCIIGNLARHLGDHLQPPCGVYTEAGIVPADRDDSCYKADLAVSCASLEADPSWVPDPVLIVEVLSPSTAEHDRSTKLADYRRLPSVRDILIVSSRERRVELLRREACLKEMVAAGAAGEIARWLERADHPPRSARCTPLPLRRVVAALAWHLRVGGSWRALPAGFPAWRTVYGWFRRWLDLGLFDALLRAVARRRRRSPRLRRRPLRRRGAPQPEANPKGSSVKPTQTGS